MNKIVRRTLKTVLWIVIILVALVVTLPLWISPVASTSVKVAVPKVLGTEASLRGIGLNPFSCSVSVNGFDLQNPVAKGFSTNSMFAVEKIFVDLDGASLTGDIIHIEKIEVADPLIRFELKGVSDNNFSALLDNLKKPAAEGEGGEVKAESGEVKAESGEGKAEGGEPKAAKKVVIDEIVLSGAKVEFASFLTAGAALPIPIPTITLHDIGKDKDGKPVGASITDALTEIINAIMTAAMKASTGAVDLGGKALEGLKGLGGKSLDGASEGAKAVGDALKKFF